MPDTLAAKKPQVGKSIVKTCPFCAEEIRDDALKCRYCHEFLGEAPRSTSSPEAGALWEYRDFYIDLRSWDLGDFPRVGKNEELIISSRTNPVVRDEANVDKSAREVLWYYLSELLADEQANLAGEGWEPVPGSYTHERLNLELVSPWGIGCFLYIILFPITLIPFLGSIVEMLIPLPADYHKPVGVTLQMRRRRAQSSANTASRP